MRAAFWDSIRADLKQGRYEHLSTLIAEVRDRLCALTPNRLDLRSQTCEVLDPTWLSDILEHEALDPSHFVRIVEFVTARLRMFCSPANDDLALEFQRQAVARAVQGVIWAEFVPWFFSNIYWHLEKIEPLVAAFRRAEAEAEAERERVQAPERRDSS